MAAAAPNLAAPGAEAAAGDAASTTVLGQWGSFTTFSIADDSVGSKEGIDVETFLAAAEGLTNVFGLFGMGPFKLVRDDMLGNIQKIRKRREATKPKAPGTPDPSDTLQKLCIDEKNDGSSTATEGLLWLTRGLEFTHKGLTQNLANDTEELSASFRSAYGSTLKPFHNFVVKGLFTAAMSACPYRKDFYAKLGNNPAVVHAEMDIYLKALGHIVVILNSFLPAVIKTT